MPTSTRVHAVTADSGGSLISAALLERELTFTISQRGEHWVPNALAVLAAVEALGGDVAVAGLALADMGGLKGRGQRHMIEIDGGEVAADRRELQRQSGVDGGDSEKPRRRDATWRAGSPCSAPMRELGEHARRAPCRPRRRQCSTPMSTA